MYVCVKQKPSVMVFFWFFLHVSQRGFGFLLPSVTPHPPGLVKDQTLPYLFNPSLMCKALEFLFVSAGISLCDCVSDCVCVSISLHVYRCDCVCVCISLYVYLCVCVCHKRQGSLPFQCVFVSVFVCICLCL